MMTKPLLAKMCNCIFPPDCGTPSKIGYEFGVPVPDTLFGSEVPVSCAECYEGPPDETSLSCQANGHWESASGCNKIGM